jgi:hypothetical protein
MAAAIAVPTIAFGNARNNVGNEAAVRAAQTPLVALMSGAQEVPGPGDTDGAGAAAVTFDLAAVAPNVCWDFTYSGIVQPTAAHIHTGAVGVGGGIIITFTPASLAATSATGCKDLTGPEILAAPDIVANPANYYVNIHNADFANGAIRGQLSSGPKSAGETHLLPTPLRAYDSRDAAGPKIQPGETRTISLATGHTLAAPTVKVLALPPGATAAIITLTIAETNAPGGFLTIYSAASPQPATSSINWKAADQDIAVGTQVAVDATGSVRVTDGVGTAPTHFIIDVVGYLY